MNFNCGNAVKYIWRADLKGNALEDLQKAKFYIKRELQRRRTLTRGQEISVTSPLNAVAAATT